MEKTKLALCPDCCCCPEVEMLKDEVVIRDDYNGIVRLPKSAWNALVTFIRDEKLKAL